jgi:hypothetical protein
MPEPVSLVQVANVPRVREGNQSGLVENNMVQTGSYSLHSNGNLGPACTALNGVGLCL